MLKSIPITQIDTSRPRLRQVNKAWVETMAAEIAAGSSPLPIEVIAQADGTYRLITGAHRLAAHVQLGRSEIEARIFAADALNEHDILLKEVQENIVRAELTALDRAASIVAWKRLYEDAKTLQKRGRKAKPELIAETANNSHDGFVERFSLAASRVLAISERSVQIAVSIATKLSPDIKARIFDQPIADQQSELLQLAAQTLERQVKIVDQIMADLSAGAPPTVAEAIALIDQMPAPVTLFGWQKINDGFARLKTEDRYAFFDSQREEIARWQAVRSSKGKRAA